MELNPSKEDISKFIILTRKLLEDPNIPFEVIKNKIDLLKKHFSYIINPLINKYRGIEFSKEEITGLINTALCNYLLIWLENSQNTKQVAYSFTLGKYSLENKEESNENPEEIPSLDSPYVSSIYRGIKIYRDNIIVQNTQAKREKTSYKRLPYSANKYTKYNFLELAFAEMHEKKYMEFYRLFYLQKKPLETLGENKDLYDIGYIYRQFDLFINEVICSPTEKLYTIKSLLLYKLEYTYRLIFVAHISKYIKDNNIDLSSELPTILNAYYMRKNLTEMTDGIHISPFVQKYNSLISLAFQNKSTENELKKILIARDIVTDSLALYNSIFPERICCKWTNDDFSDAAIFLKTDYNISDMLGQLNFDDFDSNTFDNIKMIYLNLGLIDLENFNFAREELQKKAKQRNKKKK